MSSQVWSATKSKPPPFVCHCIQLVKQNRPHYLWQNFYKNMKGIWQRLTSHINSGEQAAFIYTDSAVWWQRRCPWDHLYCLVSCTEAKTTNHFTFHNNLRLSWQDLVLKKKSDKPPSLSHVPSHTLHLRPCLSLVMGNRLRNSTRF